MTILASLNHVRAHDSSTGKAARMLGRNVTAGCSAVLALALACSLPQPSTQVVHAYSGNGKVAGANLFHERGCEHCHGVDGRGSERGPDLSTVGKRWKKQQIERQIHDGGGGMPAFGDALAPDEIKDLVDFLHAKRKATKISAGKTTTKAPADSNVTSESSQ
jgi:mono/diheme cytochrome c family protein